MYTLGLRDCCGYATDGSSKMRTGAISEDGYGSVQNSKGTFEKNKIKGECIINEGRGNSKSLVLSLISLRPRVIEKFL